MYMVSLLIQYTYTGITVHVVYYTLCDSPLCLGGCMTHSCTFTPTVDTLGGRAALESRNTESRVVLPRPCRLRIMMIMKMQCTVKCA